MITIESVLAKKDSIASRIVQEGEAVVVKPASGELRTLNEVGSRIWRLLDGKKSLEEIAQIVETEFEEVDDHDIRKDIIDFCKELLEDNLVEVKK